MWVKLLNLYPGFRCQLLKNRKYLSACSVLEANHLIRCLLVKKLRINGCKEKQVAEGNLVSPWIFRFLPPARNMIYGWQYSTVLFTLFHFSTNLNVKIGLIAVIVVAKHQSIHTVSAVILTVAVCLAVAPITTGEGNAISWIRSAHPQVLTRSARYYSRFTRTRNTRSIHSTGTSVWKLP